MNTRRLSLTHFQLASSCIRAFSHSGALGYDRLLKINGASSVPFTISDNDRLEQADYMGA